MNLLCTLAPTLLGLALAAAPALAQTNQPKLPTHRVTRMPPRGTSTQSSTAAPQRGSGTNDNGKGQGSYAAPGEPVNVQDNGKNTPSYDGPAAGRTSTSKSMTMPRKQ